MICNKCKNRFANINGLKFCPYCGEKIEGNINIENLVDASARDKKRQFTQEMPAITDEDIKKYKRDKFVASFKKIFVHKKVIIPIIALLLTIAVGVVACTIFIIKPVDEQRIKQDLIGQVLTLPKGTKIKINNNNIKDLNINSSSTDKSQDDVKVSLTLNNGAVEANTILSLVYVNEGKNEWKFNNKIVLDSVTSIKPVVGMNAKEILSELGKRSIAVSDTLVALNKQDVKKLNIISKTMDLENGKEEVLVETSIDSGLLATTGKIKCKLVFENETWNLDSISQNSKDDFKLLLSPAFSDNKVLELIREQGMDETVSYSDFFGGKGFAVKDRFTKSIKISSKKFDAQKGTLTVIAKRENAAGEIKSTLSSNYVFSISLSKISLLNGSKTTVDSGSINNVITKTIIPTITNAEIEGSNLFFWWSNNHKITTEEAKTFKTSDILSKKGYENIKYVYGSITSIDGKSNESKNIKFVALYFLVYDNNNGYNWKLNKLVGEDSPNYKDYSNIAKN
ncbi:hypothetical protein LGK95_12900 [Clostridium algoriphilum]|uniref:hypothetical protein n=1 Tax=Clostridium algoriphilum TaxID=198347 RepID=UPI001CF477DA|nr:hypothetical protein [Clostridium algoriphilum]MCB2294408.1 hypothetical protein [Clostridium algoriphilum]